MSTPETYVMANANMCTVHPQHVMVDQGYSLPHFADVFRCACGETRIEHTDEWMARYGGEP